MKGADEEIPNFRMFQILAISMDPSYYSRKFSIIFHYVDALKADSKMDTETELLNRIAACLEIPTKEDASKIDILHAVARVLGCNDQNVRYMT